MQVLLTLPSSFQEKFCLDLSSLDSEFNVNLATSVVVQVAASNRFQTSVFSNATYQYPGKCCIACTCVSLRMIVAVCITAYLL